MLVFVFNIFSTSMLRFLYIFVKRDTSAVKRKLWSVVSKVCKLKNPHTATPSRFYANDQKAA